MDKPMTPIFADEPVEVRQPRRALARILILYTVMSFVLSIAGAYVAARVAVHQSRTHTDARFSVLEKDLTERRARAAADNARRDKTQAETTALVCTVLDHLQPRDDAVSKVRAQYKCTGP